MKNLGHEPYRYKPLLIITSKIHDDLNLFIDSADNWGVKTVLNALKAEITTKEKTVFVSKHGENVRNECFRELVTGSTLLIQQVKSLILCSFCKKLHST